MVEKDPRRTFSKREKEAAWLAEDGISPISGEPVDLHKSHGDHRVAYSQGGPTSIENCDVVTPQENLKKGASRAAIDRFKWQDEFVQKWTEHSEANFFLCALPGGGKTRASARIIRLWLERGGIVVVVTPTLPIRRNWRRQLAKLKIYLDENFYGSIREKYHGILSTYAAVKGQSLAFRRLCARHDVLLVCDEIHHASEDEKSQWGVDLREAFAQAKRRLLLSGTPVRSDKEITQFLEVEDFVDDDGNPGKRYKMHYVYDWPRALADGVVRSIAFHRVGMKEVEVQYPTKGKKKINEDEDPWLTYALDERRLLLHILKAANEKLDELRLDDPSAAALAVAKNIGHAKILYDLLKMVGQEPVMVHSEQDEKTSDVIELFENDFSRRWIISVQQVSEGVDIPRLRVLAYCTNYATELAFRQLVGRVVRRRERETDDEAQAHVFLPETPRLTKLAAKIEALQALAFKRSGGGDPPTGEHGQTVGGSAPEFVGYIIHGAHYVGDRANVIRQLMAKYKVNERSAVLMLDDIAVGLKLGEGADDISEPQSMDPWDEEKLLKGECNDLVDDIVKIRMKKQGKTYSSKIWQELVSQVHSEFMVDGVGQPQMSVSQLSRKKQRLLTAKSQEEGGFGF